ncbi:hypothetical protein LGMK_08880 [Leuconostoc sp. C2]|uniref:Uncharacterized protein n=2 Tax=Leuconostoc kimchii TaxID=136609 RepID=D5T1T6_LEUKI|nr:hypothetical protein LKI_03465 [Leuconostoc kimchii IMSNU 11154]AEJ31825.1 hypothetical protein LGMK_08880 [Leuconostoc sp. C2]QBR46746.1 hypothetical protein EW139_00850 [Leuconostoc kimchii]
MQYKIKEIERLAESELSTISGGTNMNPYDFGGYLLGAIVGKPGSDAAKMRIGNKAYFGTRN